jgi:glutathione S-transferase
MTTITGSLSKEASMSLTLYFHPLSSFCWKALIGLYALECRLRDRLYDTYIHLPMQKIVGDRRRPEDRRDPLGVEQARAQMETAYALADEQLREGPWAMGADFTLADCSALPALFYGDKVAPFAAR